MPTLGWRWLVALSSLPLLLLLLFLPLLPESPRFLLVKGRSEEALATLTRMAAANGKALPRGTLCLTLARSEADGKELPGEEDVRADARTCEVQGLGADGGTQRLSSPSTEEGPGSAPPSSSVAAGRAGRSTETASGSAAGRGSGYWQASPSERETLAVRAEALPAGQFGGLDASLGNGGRVEEAVEGSVWESPDSEPLLVHSSSAADAGDIKQPEKSPAEQIVPPSSSGSSTMTGNHSGSSSSNSNSSSSSTASTSSGSSWFSTSLRLLQPPHRSSTLLLWAVFFANAFSYYGLVLLTAQLAGTAAAAAASTSACAHVPALDGSGASAAAAAVTAAAAADPKDGAYADIFVTSAAGTGLRAYGFAKSVLL